METVQLKALPRVIFGKGAARRERSANHVPGVVYAKGEAALHVSFDAKELGRSLASGRNTIFEVDLSAAGQPNTLALVKEIQRHATKPMIQHVDFLAVQPESEVVVQVPIELVGTPEGVRLGGKLRRHERTLSLRCRANAIPANIPVDISGLKPTDTLLLSHVTPPEGTKLVFRYDLAVCSVTSIAAGMDRPEFETPTGGAPAEEKKEPKKEEKKEEKGKK